MALSLCGVLGVALYFSEGFSETAARVSAVMGHLDTNNFYFIFFYFSDFTLLYFTFLLKDDEEGM